MTYVCGKWIKICGKRDKYIRNGFTMLEVASEFDKRLKYVGNGVDLWEMAKICVEMA